MNHFSKVLGGLLSAVVLCLPAYTSAQEVLEEIVVTATRREANLQDVPIAVFALTGDEMELRGIDRVENLDLFVPNVSLQGAGASGAAGGSDFVIRGIPGVGVYVDGIWQPSGNGLAAMNMIELERVEVMRGPQGTLFGKNTMSGAIQYVTRRPGDEFGARLRLTAGDYNRQDIEVGIDIPLSDTLKMKLTGAQLKREGFIQSLESNVKYGDINDTVARLDLVWEPNDDFSLRFVSDHLDVDRNGAARVVNDIVELPGECPPTHDCLDVALARRFALAGLDSVNNFTSTAGFPGGQVGEYETRVSFTRPGTVNDTDRITLDIIYDINDNLSFRALTGYREQTTSNYANFAGIKYDLIERDFSAKSEHFSQEFQLIGDTGRFNWTVGAYYSDFETVNRTYTWWWQDFKDDPTLTGTFLAGCGVDLGLVGPCRVPWAGFSPPFTPNLGLPTTIPHQGNSLTLNQDDTVAFFGEVNFALTDRLGLILGFRESDEDVFEGVVPALDAFIDQSSRPGAQIPGDRFAHGAIVPDSDSDLNFKSTTIRAGLQFDVSDDVMVYASYSEGFGAGGANIIDDLADNNPPLGPIIILPYLPEEVESFELGLRGDYMNNRLRINATYFMMDWLEIQAMRTPQGSDCLPFGVDPDLCDGLAFFIRGNVGTAEASGLEVEGTFIANANWRFNFNLGLLDTEYTELSGNSPLPINAEFAQAPDMTYSLGVQHDAALSNGSSITTRFDYGYVDDYWRDQDPEVQSGVQHEGYGVLNASVGYRAPGGNWGVRLFGTNLTEERWINSGFFSETIRFDVSTVSRPREIGATFNFFFD